MIADITLLLFIRYIQCGTGDSIRHSKVPAKAVTRNKSHSDDNGRKNCLSLHITQLSMEKIQNPLKKLVWPCCKVDDPYTKLNLDIRVLFNDRILRKGLLGIPSL